MPSRRNNRQYQPQPKHDRVNQGETGFTCIHCNLYITCDSLIAGVQNRNHCPYCLWSRHLDWRTAGDRLSSCKAGMKPVGLTTKRGRNKYAKERDGELMLIHQCTGCDTIIINRIAADDGEKALMAVFEESQTAAPTLQAALEPMGITMLTSADAELVRRRLFGGE